MFFSKKKKFLQDFRNIFGTHMTNYRPFIFQNADITILKKFSWHVTISRKIQRLLSTEANFIHFLKLSLNPYFILIRSIYFTIDGGKHKCCHLTSKVHIHRSYLNLFLTHEKNPNNLYIYELEMSKFVTHVSVFFSDYETYLI